jgi:hypothetical protein
MPHASPLSHTVTATGADMPEFTALRSSFAKATAGKLSEYALRDRHSFSEGGSLSRAFSLSSDRISAEAEFHQDDRRKETDSVPYASKNPIRMEICPQVIAENVGIEKHLAGYRYGHGRRSPFKLPFKGFIPVRTCCSSTSSESARSMASCSDSTPKYRLAKSMFV